MYKLRKFNTFKSPTIPFSSDCPCHRQGNGFQNLSLLSTKFFLANMWASESFFNVTYKTPNRENTNNQISLVWNLLIIMLVKNFCVLVVLA